MGNMWPCGAYAAKLKQDPYPKIVADKHMGHAYKGIILDPSYGTAMG